MSYTIPTIILITVYAAIILYFVISGAKKTSSLSDYAVGSIAFSPWSVGLSLAASITSAATFVINPGFIALYGKSAIIAFGIIMPIGVFISLIILTKSFRKYGSSVKAKTMAEWMGKRYDNLFYRHLFGVLTLLLIAFIVLILVGLTKVLSSALNASELYVLIGLVVFVFGYMMFGGANSMVYTNTIQAILMIVVAIIMLSSGYEHLKDGVNGMWAALDRINPFLDESVNPESFLFRDWFEIAVCSFVVGVAVVCQPHIITKSLLLKTDRDVNWYLIVAIIVEALFFSVVWVGLFARLRFPDLMLNGHPISMDSIIPTYVVSEFPVFLGLVVILGLISAGLSTLEGLIQSVPTSLTSDLIAPLFLKKHIESDNEKKKLMINRGVIVFLAVASAILSYQQLINPSLSVAIFAQNGVYAYFAAAFIPVLFGIFLKDAPSIAAIGASITALIVHFGVYYGRVGWYMQTSVRNPAVSVTYAIFFSLIVGVVLYFIFRKANKGVTSKIDVA